MDLKDVNDIASLSQLLQIKKQDLTYILYRIQPSNCYTQFEIPKKNGGVRIINAPHKTLKIIQKKLALILLNYYEAFIKNNNLIHEVSYGYEKGKEIYGNAYKHKNKRFVLNVDLENFFDQFHFGRVSGFFNKNQYFQLSNNISIILANLVCYHGTLPQGAPTSPIITNLMCRSFDRQILNLAKKYKLHYTRYVDDLTFSTNNKYFAEEYEIFFAKLQTLCNKYGFPINQNKIKFQNSLSRQIVTGLCVNKKVNVLNTYYKNTRAMANSLYGTNSFTINNIEATINQLNGRFNFINYIDKQNNINNKKNNIINAYTLNKREIEYKKFLFYKYFLINEPLMITEGKTDEKHIKAALKKYYTEYPNLINFDGHEFTFHIRFLKRTATFKYLFSLYKDGADALQNICQLYRTKQLSYKDESLSFYEYFRNKYKITPINPVIFIMDNEIENKDKPIRKFLNGTNNIDLKTQLEQNYYIKLKNSSNMYLMTFPRVNNMQECEIEDLHTGETLNIPINGKYFNKNGGEQFYGKEIFANFVSKNYNTINMDNFKNILDKINEIITNFRTT